jgi:uncharacterized protein YjiS (DUF1127 family)
MIASHAIGSRFMSMPFNNTNSLRLSWSGSPAPRHQSNSWPGWAALLNEWLGWSEHSRQRAALHDVADDRHLLHDLGLTRQEALHESKRTF